jgi:putative endonuclease
MGSFYVYILASRSRVLYVGVTNDLERRVFEHKQGIGSQFTRKYRVNQLVYCQSFATPGEAIAAEKRIKGWVRAKKIALIEEANPDWHDLSSDDTRSESSCSANASRPSISHPERRREDAPQ